MTAKIDYLEKYDYGNLSTAMYNKISESITRIKASNELYASPKVPPYILFCIDRFSSSPAIKEVFKIDHVTMFIEAPYETRAWDFFFLYNTKEDRFYKVHDAVLNLQVEEDYKFSKGGSGLYF